MIEDELTLGDYFAVVRRRLWLIVVCFVAVVALAAVFSALQTPMFRSTARVLVNQSSAAEIFESQVTQNNSFADRLAANEVALIESQLVDDVAEERLGFEAEVSASAQSQADVLSISAEDADPVVAQQIAQTYVEAYLDVRLQQYVNERIQVAEQLLDRIGRVDEQIAQASEDDAARLQELRDGLADQYDQLNISAELAEASGARVIDAADLPEAAFAPQTARNVALGGVLGLLLGIGLALLVEALDRSVRSRDALEASTPGVPSLAAIPSLRSTDGAVTLSHPNGSESESFRTLRAAIEFAAIDDAVTVLQVTSAGAAAGKTTVASNLAVAMAQAGQVVALVDADLRRPRVHSMFGLAPDDGSSDAPTGLTSAILGRADLVDSARELGLDNGRLWVYTSGPLPPGPAELLGSKRTGQLFAGLRESFDVIIVDSPPVLPVADSLVLSRLADATLLVANAKRTRRDELSQASAALESAGARLIGTVLNQASSSSLYGYGYGYTAEPARPRRSRFGRKTPGEQQTAVLARADLPRFEAAGRRLGEGPFGAERPSVRVADVDESFIDSPTASSASAQDGWTVEGTNGHHAVIESEDQPTVTDSTDEIDLSKSSSEARAAAREGWGDSVSLD
ncbi:MAG: polysaccharide biosynthesis tyrosine autokinase [Actinomycetota bacterium]